MAAGTQNGKSQGSLYTAPATRRSAGLPNNSDNQPRKVVPGNRPKAVVQMDTGSGKTFTAITSIYRLLKFAKAKRVLFLVNTRNLGEQAEQECKKFEPQDDNRLFPETVSS